MHSDGAGVEYVPKNRANRGAVVTNNTYTPSARALANSHNILLLHHDDLHVINQNFNFN